MKFNPSAIVQAREALGMTQSDLARKLGVTRQWINLLESGAHNPTTRTLQKLFEGLGVTDPGPFFIDTDEKGATWRP